MLKRAGTRNLLVLGLSLFFAINSTAQTPITNATDSLFQQAIALDVAGKSAKAVPILARLTTEHPQIDIYCFAYARALYHSNTLGEARTVFEQYVETFALSPMQKEALYFLGNISVQLNNLTDATSQYLRAYAISSRDKTTSPQFIQLLDSSLTSLFRRATSVYPNANDFVAIPPEAACALTNRLASIRQQVGDDAGAARLLSLCSKQQPPVVSKTGSGLKVAVVLPFTGDNAQFAEEIFNGATIATAQSGCAHQIQLVPFDTEGDKITAARLIQDIAKDSSYLAAIGPLTSDESAVAAAALNAGNLPLLVPAASDAGFTEFSRSVFQLTPNIGVQASRMAIYAKEQLHADSAVILTADDAEHHQMAELFARRFTEAGGVIVAQMFYAPGERDFKPFIGDIKSTLRREDSDSLAYINVAGDTLDPDERPVHIDCLYLPGEPEQIRLLLPQLKFYNLNGAYLGSDEWADAAVYGLGEAVLKDVVFPSAHLQTAETEESVQFASRYLSQYQTKSTRLAQLGYDAVRCICANAKADTPDRLALTTALAGLHAYTGLSGEINFGKLRVNTAMPLYRVHNGLPSQVEEHPVASESDSGSEL